MTKLQTQAQDASIINIAKQNLMQSLTSNGFSSKEAIHSINEFSKEKSPYIFNPLVNSHIDSYNGAIMNSATVYEADRGQMPINAMVLNPARIIKQKNLKGLAGQRSYKLSVSELSAGEIKVDSRALSLQEFHNELLTEDSELNITEGAKFLPYVIARQDLANMNQIKPEQVGQSIQQNSQQAFMNIQNFAYQVTTNKFRYLQIPLFNQLAYVQYNQFNNIIAKSINSSLNLTINPSDMSEAVSDMLSMHEQERLLTAFVGNGSNIEGLFSSTAGTESILGSNSIIPASLTSMLTAFFSAPTASNAQPLLTMMGNLEALVSNGKINFNSLDVITEPWERPKLVLPYSFDLISAMYTRTYSIYQDRESSGVNFIKRLFNIFDVYMSEFCSSSSDYNKKFLGNKDIYLIYDQNNLDALTKTVQPMIGVLPFGIEDPRFTSNGIDYRVPYMGISTPFLSFDNSRRIKIKSS
jgi:hypothetical protein